MGSHNFSPIKKRQVADKLLKWLKDNDIETWVKTYSVFVQASEELNEEIFNLWKAYELLRSMGRVVLNCGNGKKGAHVVDYTPLALPIPEGIVVCSKSSCPFLKVIPEIFGARR